MRIGSQEFITKFKNLFEKEKNRLLFSGQIMDEQFVIQSDEMMDELDITAFELDNQMRMRLRNRETLYLKKIDEALARISSGTFGHCRDCEEEIELKRLEARPTTSLCIACKENSERNEKLHIDGHKYKSLGCDKVRLA